MLSDVKFMDENNRWPETRLGFVYKGYEEFIGRIPTPLFTTRITF